MHHVTVTSITHQQGIPNRTKLKIKPLFQDVPFEILSLDVMNFKDTAKSNGIGNIILLVFLVIPFPGIDSVSAQVSHLSPESMYAYHWNEVDWSQRFREVYLYNSRDQLTQTSSHISNSGSWYNDWRSYLTYDTQGLLIERLQQNGAGSDWYNLFRDQYSYDDSVRLIAMTHQLVDGDSWRNSERRLYAYDGANRLSEEIIQSRVGNNWLNDIRVISIYNPTGFVDTSLNQIWDYDAEGWLPNTLERFYYDSEGQQTQWNRQSWVVDHWHNHDREIDSYNSTGQMIEHITQSWVGNSWINIERTVHSYGSDLFVEVSTIQEWDYDETIWYDKSRQLFSLDNAGNKLNSTNQSWYQQGAEWLNEWRYEWSYPTTSIVSGLLPERFILGQNYPNPFNPTTTISFTLSEPDIVILQVLDIRGCELITLQNASLTPGNYSVEWNGMDHSGKPLSAGMYLCRLQSRQESRIIKMVFLK